MKLILENWKKYLEEEETEEETPEVDENLLNIARETLQITFGKPAKAALGNIEADEEFQATGKRYGARNPMFDFDSFPEHFTEFRKNLLRRWIRNDERFGKRKDLADQRMRRVLEDKIYEEIINFGSALEKIWADPELKEEFGKKLVKITGYSWVQAASLAEDLLEPEEPEESEV